MDFLSPLSNTNEQESQPEFSKIWTFSACAFHYAHTSYLNSAYTKWHHAEIILVNKCGDLVSTQLQKIPTLDLIICKERSKN